MINLTDKYKTRCGYPVEVHAIDFHGDYPVLFSYKNDKNLKFCGKANEKGNFQAGRIHELDLIKVNPYDHIKRGDVVWVWDDDEADGQLRLFVSVGDDGDDYPVKTAINRELTQSGCYKHCELYQAKDEK